MFGIDAAALLTMVVAARFLFAVAVGRGERWPGKPDATDVAGLPFVVGLTSSDSDDPAVCTGTLVSPLFVLSSARCTARLTDIRAYRWRRSAKSVDYRRTDAVYEHPLYDRTKRVADLCLIRLIRPFRQVDGYAKLVGSRAMFDGDVELKCTVAGIGIPLHGPGNSYAVPVWVKYGRSACRIPKLNPGIMYVIADTWSEFLCARTRQDANVHLPCNRGDPVVCDGDKQYGITSYGYSTRTSRSAEETECGDPAVQSRHLLVNNHAQWVADTVANHTAVVGGRRPTSTTAETPYGASGSFRNASPSDPLNYPYLVYLESFPGEPACGGTLISPSHVLTTARCTTRMSKIEASVVVKARDFGYGFQGATGCLDDVSHRVLNAVVCKVYAMAKSHRQHANASHVYVHPDFEVTTLTADISVVVLREPLNVSRFVQLADFLRPPDDDESKSLSCVVVVKNRVTPYDYVSTAAEYGPNACSKSDDVEIQKTVNRTWREFICGRWQTDDRPYGDAIAGYPLICDGLQYGIASHSYRSTSDDGRTETDQVRYLQVNNHKQWIDTVMLRSRAAAVGTRCENRVRSYAFAVLSAAVTVGRQKW